MIKKNDIILACSILVLGLAVILFINFTKASGSKVALSVDGKVIKTFYMKDDTTYTYHGKNGDWNKFTIKDGVVDMIDASCPDKICVHQPSIKYNNEAIVCLPNKVVLEVIDGEDNNVDMTAN
ncbi:MAG TPA: NusG domain II-containing protein [Mobilitalea sp.]|nr:NusG domain II-containing protein [Mobilitalea sp.]